MGGQSGSWTPTKRRGPIAAEFQGPGPAAIGLPSLFGSKSTLINRVVGRYKILGGHNFCCLKVCIKYWSY